MSDLWKHCLSEYYKDEGLGKNTSDSQAYQERLFKREVAQKQKWGCSAAF